MRRRGRNQLRDPRRLGLEVAVGLDIIDLDPDAGDRLGRRCPQCGETGRIDMIDTAEQRAYLSCPACGSNWDTDRVESRA